MADSRNLEKLKMNVKTSLHHIYIYSGYVLLYTIIYIFIYTIIYIFRMYMKQFQSDDSAGTVKCLIYIHMLSQKAW